MRDPKSVRGIPRSALRSLRWTYREPPARNLREFLTRNIWPWITNYLRVMFHHRHDFVPYPQGESGIFALEGTCTVALAADWGTGTDSAYRVASLIRDQHADATIHMGDVYFSGTREEYAQWFLGPDDWPSGGRYTFAMNGNHEMYSGGVGYFDAALPKLHQPASYFCLETPYWRIVGLDTGYYSGILPLVEFLFRSQIRLHDVICKWLRDVIFAKADDQRPVILLSHHQLFSAFDHEYATIGKNVRPYLDRVCLWFWGHEHRLAGYAPLATDGLPAVRARCIGHGGMPIEIGAKPTRGTARNLVFYDDRERNASTIAIGEPTGYCGFALLRFKNERMSVEYVDEDGTTLLTEEWVQTPDGVRGAIVGQPVVRAVAGTSLADLVK